MTSEDIQESQVDESGMGGPGAPTPLSALEVCTIYCFFTLHYIHVIITVLMRALTNIGSIRPH